MVFLIAGCSHTGKTHLAQRILETYSIPYLSIDHLKMGLIRSGLTDLTPKDDFQLTGFLWPIIREIIKTVIENNQNLVVEGCYIPFDWKDDFNGSYLEEIKYICLIMSAEYIEQHLPDIMRYADIVEKRAVGFSWTKELLITENATNLAMCKRYGCHYALIERIYEEDIKNALDPYNWP